MSAIIYRTFRTQADGHRHEEVVDPTYAEAADPDYDETGQPDYEDGSDPNYDEGAQPDYGTDFADPDSGEVRSQEYASAARNNEHPTSPHPHAALAPPTPQAPSPRLGATGTWGAGRGGGWRVVVRGAPRPSGRGAWVGYG